MSILQKRSVRLIKGSKYNSHTGPIFRSLRLLTLQDIFQLECCKIFAKFCQGQLSQYLSNTFVTSSSTPLYRFRHTTNISPPIVKTKFEEQLILFKVASAWNSPLSPSSPTRNTRNQSNIFVINLKIINLVTIVQYV
jgi:hypothetical protein